MCIRDRLQDDPFEIRPFLYLNFPAWVGAKIQHKTMGDIIQEKLAQTV